MPALHLPTMLKADRERAGLSVPRTAVLLGVKVAEYRAIESGESYPDFDTWDAICKTFGWAQTFVVGRKPALAFARPVSP